jgi:hypothetical protein
MVELRLGDLYSELARRTFQSEIEEKKTHSQSSLQRSKATQYYQTATKRINHHRLFFETQMKLATLFAETGDTKKALDTLNFIINNKNTPPDIRQVATLHRGHAYFSSGHYKMAEADYIKVLSRHSLSESELILVYYRLAWSQAQLQKTEEAKKNYSQAIHVLSKSGNKEGLDIYLDYASLLIQDKSSSVKDIQSIIQKAHPEFQNRLTIDIGDESFRVARYDIAQPLYTLISKDNRYEDHVQILAKLRIVFIQSKKDEDKNLIESFKAVLRKAKSCSQSAEKCKMIQSEIRSFVIQVHKIKKAQPDQIVLETYKAYLDVYPEEPSMFIAAAAVASYLDKHTDSRVLFEKGILCEKDPKIREDYLVTNLSRAESSGDETDKKLSYLFYLKHGHNLKLKSEIELELAHMAFKKQDYASAFNQAYHVSQSNNAPLKTRMVASEIAIQSLIKQKNDSEILRVAKEYSKQFESKKSYFDSIAKQAQVSLLIAATQKPQELPERDLVSKFNEIKTIAQNEKNGSEKKLLIQNLIRIADASNQANLKKESLLLFLSLKGITQNEKVEATSKLYQTYISEMEFSKAFQLGKANQSLLGLADIELAQLADISGIPTQAILYYEKSSNSHQLSKQEKSKVATRLIHLSGNTKRALTRYFNSLKLDSSNMDQSLSFLYITSPDLRKNIQSLTKSKTLPQLKSAENRILGLEFLKSLNFKDPSKLSLTHSPSSLKSYQNYLLQLDQTLLKANKKQHLASQAVTLRAIEFFNKKFVEDLSHLPIPKEITKEMEKDYLEQIKTLSRPYLEKSILARQQAEKIERTLFESLKSERLQARFEMTPFLDEEARLINKKLLGVGSRIEDEILTKISKERQLEWRSQLAQLREQIHENFYSLETQFGNPVLASFLRDRKADKKSGARL